MDNLNIPEPIFNNWYIEEKLGSGAFGTVYKIKREEFGESFHSALKVIQIPSESSEVDALRSEGMDDNSITSYYGEIVQELLQEISILNSLKGNSNIVSYEDHSIITEEEGKQHTILIRMELLTPLNTYLIDHKLSDKDIVKLGMDLCSALRTCEKHNIIHRDIKPDNIFVTADGDFKLGDFGVARTMEKTMSAMSQKGTYTYMAPEVYYGKSYDKTVDIYSLGLVLYQLLNGNRAPFLPLAPTPIKFSDRENALKKRMNGENVPPLSIGNTKLNEIVLKACSFASENRYKTAEAMLFDLSNVFSTDEPKREKIVTLHKDGKFIDVYESELEEVIHSIFGGSQAGSESTAQAPAFNQNSQNEDADADKTVGAFDSVPNTEKSAPQAPAFNQSSQSEDADADKTVGAFDSVPNSPKTAPSNPAIEKNEQNNEPELDKTVSAFDNVSSCTDSSATASRHVAPAPGFFKAYSLAWKNCFNYKGRARRSEFWKFMSVNIVLFVGCMILTMVMPDDALLDSIIHMWGVYTVVTILPRISLMVRRLHDLDKSGWCILLILVPALGWVLLVMWWCTDGNAGIYPNRFGESTKYIWQ